MASEEIDKRFLLSKEWTSTEGDIFDRVNLLACFFACKAFKHPSFEPEEVLVDRFDRLLKDTLFGAGSEGLLQTIRESNLGSVCGKILRNGEPAYNCKDCETDPTCVLCMDCFEHSEHRQHHYKLITSSGSGCCDCGDTEAWRSGVHCEKHLPGQSSSEESQLDCLTPQLITRAQDFLKALLSFCRDILCLNEDEPIPDAYRTKDVEKLISEQCYVTVLYNDEVHSYDDVIGALTRHDVGMDQMGAVSMASIVDSMGRGFTRVASKDECDQQKAAINQRLRTPLLVKVLSSPVISLQQCAINLLLWAKELTGGSAALRHVVSKVLLETKSLDGEGGSQSILDHFFAENSSMWIAARMSWQNLIMKTIFLDPEHKKDLAISLAKNFPALMQGYFEDSHHYEVSAANLTVQLFTVPSLCHLLVLEHGLLKTVMQTLYGILNQFASQPTGKLDLSQRGYSNGRMVYVIADLRYVLRNRPDNWSPTLRANFVEAFHVFLKLLDLIQGLDPVKRQRYQHITMEPEWESLFNLCFVLLEAIEQVVEWCHSDSAVLHQTVKLTLKQIQTSCEMHRIKFRNHPVNRAAAGVDGMELIQFDVQQESVSIHQPLPRLLAALLSGAHRHGTTILGLLQIPNTSSRQFLFLAELPLRVIVMTSQVLAGMWKRNGYSLINQTINYRYHSCRPQMYDKDLLLLQAMAAVMDPNKFMYALIYRFRLEKWFISTIDYDPLERNEQPSDAVRFLLSEAEEFFYLLIVIFGERFMPGVSDVTQKDCLKQEIIHQLYISPLPHSELLKQLKLHEDKELKKVVLEVADFKKPTSTSKGQYTMKPELEKQFNPFFYHYSKVQLSKAEEAHRKKVKAKGGASKIPSTSPPKPPPFLPPFAGILRLIQCPVLHQLLHSLFSRAATPGLKYWSDKLLHEAVYLCGLMLLEEPLSGNDQFSRYAAGLTSTCKGGSILSLLETILQNKRGEEFCYLTQWVLQQLKIVRDSGGIGQQPAYDEADAPESESPKEDSGREKKQQAAAAQRRKVMEEMAALQKKFLQSNRQVLSEIDTGTNVDEVTASSATAPAVVAVGLQSVASQAQVPVPLHCILCQAVEKDAANCEKQFVLGMRIQRSTVLKKSPRTANSNKEVDIDYLLNSVALTQGVYSASCGHGMHMECWRRFHDSRIAELRQSDMLFQRRSAVNYESGEFLCPLCQYYCNTVLPIHPDPMSKRPAASAEVEIINFEQWRTRLHTLLDCALSPSPLATDNNAVRTPADSLSISSRLAEIFPKYLKLDRNAVPSFSSESFVRSSSSSSEDSNASSYSQAVFTRGHNALPNEADARVPVAVWATCAYTIQCLGCQSNFSGKSLLTSLHSRQINYLRAMVRAASCVTLPSVCPHTDTAMLGKHLSRLLNTVVPVGGCFHELPCVLDLDPFSIMVNLHFCLASLLDALDPECKMALRPLIAIDDQYIVQIAVAIRLVQYLLTVEPQGDMPDLEGSDTTGIVDLWEKLHDWALGSSCDKELTSSSPPANALLTGYRDAVLPLLQRAALFFHCCNGVDLPQEDPISYEALLHYLCLPDQLHTIVTASQGVGLRHLVQTWCQHRGVAQQIGSLHSAAPPLSCMLTEVQSLHSLPQHYSELIKIASNFRCPKFQTSNRDSTAVIMCMICGQLLCSNCYRCMTPEGGGEAIGNYTRHLRECGGGVGMGLWILECYMVMMNAMDLEDVRGCILPAPYLDEYGESDIGLRSGNPLKLNDDLWKEFQQYWYQHTIMEKITSTNEQERKFILFSWSKL